MNWKPGDMAVAIYDPANPDNARNELPSGTVVEVIGIANSMWAADMRTTKNQEVYEIKPMYLPYSYDALESVLYPIPDPDQHAEPRAEEINRPCEA